MWTNNLLNVDLHRTKRQRTKRKILTNWPSVSVWMLCSQLGKFDSIWLPLNKITIVLNSYVWYAYHLKLMGNAGKNVSNSCRKEIVAHSNGFLSFRTACRWTQSTTWRRHWWTLKTQAESSSEHSWNIAHVVIWKRVVPDWCENRTSDKLRDFVLVFYGGTHFNLVGLVI